MGQNHQQAIVGLYGYSQSGKTTLIKNIIRIYTERGISIGVIKITDKPISSEPEGKDTHVFRKSGADITILSSPAETSFVLNQAVEIQLVLKNIALISDVDLVIIEGAHSEFIPKIRIGDIPIRSNTLFTFSGNIEEVVETIEVLLIRKGLSNENHN